MAGIFKAYDVRGIVPTQLNEEIAHKIGLAFQHVLDAEDRANGNTVVVSRDMREHSEGLQNALVDGLTDSGLDVLDIGLSTTPMNYFAISHFKAAGGVQVTASHNPAQYNGFKFSRHGARPVSGDHGIALMEKKVQEGDLPKAANPGKVTQGDVFEDYQHHVLSFLREGSDGQPLKVVVDAANGMGTIDRPILEAMGIELIAPLLRARRHLPQPRGEPAQGGEPAATSSGPCARHGADLGVSFDGDADRAAFIDETGEPIGSDLMTGLIGGDPAGARAGQGGGLRPPLVAGRGRVHQGEGRHPDARAGGALLHQGDDAQARGDLRRRARGALLLPRPLLRRLPAALGGRGAEPAAAEAASRSPSWSSRSAATTRARRSTSRWRTSRGRWTSWPHRYADAEIDYLDGITISYPSWWANVRPSNTEPFLRLVLEAKTARGAGAAEERSCSGFWGSRRSRARLETPPRTPPALRGRPR